MINFNSIPLRGTEEDGNLGLSSHMSQTRLLILTSEHETKLNEQEEQTEWYSFRCSFFQQCALGAQFLVPQAVQLYGETPLSATFGGQLLDQSIACALLSQLLYSTGSQSSSYSGPLARPFCSHSLVGAYYRVFPYPYDLVHLNKWIGLPNALPTIVNSQLDRPTLADCTFTFFRPGMNHWVGTLSLAGSIAPWHLICLAKYSASPATGDRSLDLLFAFLPL